MISSYFKTGFRNLKRERLSSVINIIGLTAGIFTTMLIATYIYAELNYDSFHKKSDRIVRIITISENPENRGARTAMSMVPLVHEYGKIDGVETPTRIFKGWRGMSARYKGKVFENNPILYTDNNFFRLFDFKLLDGSFKDALKDPYTVVINRSSAIKFFGTINAAGENIQLEMMEERDKYSSFRIAAVIEDTPYNSHFSYSVFMPFANLKWLQKQKSNEVYNYFAIKEGYRRDVVLAQVKEVCDRIYKPREKYGYHGVVRFQNLKDIRLYSSDMGYDFKVQGNILRVYVFSAFPFILLFIAGLNFINILNARLQNRFKEMGLRKVLGAGKRAILYQLLGESLATVFITGIVSIVLYFSFLNGFGELVEMELAKFEENWMLISLITLAVSMLIGVIASLLPGALMARTRTLTLFEGPGIGRKKNYLVNFTVLVQFAVVVVMIISTLVIYNQLNFMKDIDPGFNREQVLNFQVADAATRGVLKNRLMNHPEFISIAGSESIPGQRRSGQLLTNFGGRTLNDRYNMYENRVESGYIKTYGLELIAGRDFIENSESDRSSIIVNEEVLKKAGVDAEEAIGKKLNYFNRDFTVIGVVKNYHFFSLKRKIDPLVLSNYRTGFHTISVRFKAGKVKEVLDLIKKEMKQLEPETAVSPVFVDEIFRKMYRKEDIFNQIVFYGAVIVILLAIGGLFALTYFAVVKKTKEIGIRKVLGATTSVINFQLIREFIKWIGFANFIALPAGYLIMRGWLNNFAYKIDLNPIYFISSTLISILLALGTIIYLTTRAASRQPAENIRYE